MQNPIDNLLNSIAMYRLVLYVLLSLAAIALLFSGLGIGQPLVPLLLSLTVLVPICYLTNILYRRIYKAPTNIESFAITALILFFIMPPTANVSDAVFLAATAFLAMASKYVLSVGKKHIFNPAAIAAVTIALIAPYAASWWIGSATMAPFVAIGAALIIRKIRKFQMIGTFVIVALAVMLAFATNAHTSYITTLTQAFTSWPLLFFAGIMLTEPLTTPPTKKLQIMYAALVGTIFAFQAPIGPIYPTPELALVIGNIFSFLVSSKEKYTLTLKEKIEEGAGVYSLIFTPSITPHFKPGQYLEWTLPHAHPDTRGNRRYFTVASSPTEPEIRLGVKFNQPSSSFKNALTKLKKGDKLIAGQLAGDFVLPDDTSKKLVWVAGGIGITPFRSMTKYLLDNTQKRDIILFYQAATSEEFAFQDIFDKATKKIGMKTIYIASNPEKGSTWTGPTGRLTPEMIKREVSNYDTRIFYLSGPSGMVNGYKKMLHILGIKRSNIITDYFPGF